MNLNNNTVTKKKRWLYIVTLKLDTYYECMVKLLFAMQKLKGNMKRIIKMTFTDFLDNMIDGQA